MNEQTFKKLQQILAAATGHEVEEIHEYTLLEEDLGVNMLEDFSRLVAIINNEFEIELQTNEVLDELEEAEDSVEVLAKLIQEEIDLG